MKNQHKQVNIYMTNLCCLSLGSSPSLTVCQRDPNGWPWCGCLSSRCRHATLDTQRTVHMTPNTGYGRHGYFMPSSRASSLFSESSLSFSCDRAESRSIMFHAVRLGVDSIRSYRSRLCKVWCRLAHNVARMLWNMTLKYETGIRTIKIIPIVCRLWCGIT